MFCTKCGKENPNGSAFCTNCGASLISKDITKSQKSPLMESISLRVSPGSEQTTINRHQKMGWILKSIQEVSISTPREHYMNLVFERDKNMSNYNILKENYDNYTKLSNQIAVVESSVKKRSKKFYLFGLLISLIMGISLSWVFFDMQGMSMEYSFDKFFYIFFSLIFSAVLACNVIAISAEIATKKAKKKIKPVVSELYQQMINIANDSEKYL